MKFSSSMALMSASLTAAMLLSPLACSKSQNSSMTTSSPIPYGSETPPGILPDLTANYRPRSLSHKVFDSDSKTYVPMDFLREDLTLTFDASAQTIQGHARIVFQTKDKGRAYFQLKTGVLNPTLDGIATAIGTVFDPDHLGNSFNTIEQDVDTAAERTFEFDYALPADRVSFENGGIGFLTDMNDLETPQFFEMWGPAGFEDDAFALTLHLKINNSSASHQIFTNGEATQESFTQWTVQFPNHFTTSSFYVHLTNRVLTVNNFSVQGVSKLIPVTVYSENSDLVEEASRLLPGLFQELEKDYGAFPHSHFVAYIHGGGGMEYAGATITDTGALGHELFHSWFARSVMPAEGRSGWIDEALASWRDHGYFQADSLLSRDPTNLASFSPFRISTPSNCYRDGRNLMAELDRFLAQFGGMKPLIRAFFERYRDRVVTTEEFQSFLNLKTQKDVAPFFEKYAFGGNSAMSLETAQSLDSSSDHPRPLTRQEVLNLR